MSQPIRHIVFDIGRVLIHYDPDLAYRSLIPDETERRRFLDTVCTSAWNLEQDRGRPWPEAEALLIAGHPHLEAEIRAFRRNWAQMIPGAIWESVVILEQLVADGHDVTMLTNFASDTFAEACERFSFLAQPRGVTVSGQLGLIKPERAIYERHAGTFGLDAAATLFIDDSLPNVAGARDAGWRAVAFTEAATLREQLLEHGIALPEPAGLHRRYHTAIDALDYDRIAALFAPGIVYRSGGVGGTIEGRDAVMEAFRTYFARFPDQRSEDVSVTALDDGRSRARWRLEATDADTGRAVVREGFETITLDGLGRIAEVSVEG